MRKLIKLFQSFSVFVGFCFILYRVHVDNVDNITLLASWLIIPLYIDLMSKKDTKVITKKVIIYKPDKVVGFDGGPNRK